MDPNKLFPSTSMDLPAVPSAESGPTAPVAQVGSERNPELLPPGNTGAGSPWPQQGQPGGARAAIAQSQLPSPVAPVQDDADDTAQLIADDIDLIEKEWVEKAKGIVNQTKDDPYQQNKALNKIKKQYIQKRYNKTIKSGDE